MTNTLIKQIEELLDRVAGTYNGDIKLVSGDKQWLETNEAKFLLIKAFTEAVDRAEPKRKEFLGDFNKLECHMGYNTCIADFKSNIKEEIGEVK